MATIKSYTDLEQSKKLAEILHLKSADMQYPMLYNRAIDGGGKRLSDIPSLKICTMSDDIPCWSLAALLGVLPKGTNISTPKPINALSYCCWNQYDEIYADNPVDACYEMILKLNELKML